MSTTDEPPDVITGLVPVIARILELDRGPPAAVDWVRDHLRPGYRPRPAPVRPPDEHLIRLLARELASRLLKCFSLADTLDGWSPSTFLASPGRP
jgi:hypothetical protein